MGILTNNGMNNHKNDIPENQRCGLAGRKMYGPRPHQLPHSSDTLLVILSLHMGSRVLKQLTAITPSNSVVASVEGLNPRLPALPISMMFHSADDKMGTERSGYLFRAVLRLDLGICL